MLNKIFILIITTICLSMFGGCMGGTKLTKDKIIQLVLDSEELLDKAVEELYGLDEYVILVSNTKFRPIGEVGFEGLYTSGITNYESVTKPLNNPILYDLLKDGKIRSIGISRAGRTDFFPDETDQIQFDCKNRGVFDWYEGFYYSKMMNPSHFMVQNGKTQSRKARVGLFMVPIIITQKK